MKGGGHLKKWLVAVIAIAAVIAVLFAFWKNGPTNEMKLGEDITLLASGKGVPANLYVDSYSIKKADNQIAYQKMWNIFGLNSASIPAVDFSKKAVVFIGLYESGSCPYKIEDAETRAGEKELAIRLTAPSGICTTDASPKTFVIEIDKSTSEKLQSVVIVRGGTETYVPVLEE